MDFAVLGPVLVDGQPPRGAIERALLARLLVAPGVPVAATELVEAAWPEERRAGAAASLRVRLTRLRGLLERDRAPGAAAQVLVREPAGYRLAVEPEHVDAVRFARLADEAATLGAAPALACCEDALALWRGEPFADLDLVDAAAAEARRLHATRDRLRHLRALALLECGQAAAAADALDELVGEDPLREALVADLMRARYRAGRQADALAAYRELTQRLAEVGLTPGPDVRELEALVLHHDGALTRPAAAPGRPTNFGARVASVLGRDGDVDAAAAALQAHRLVTLCGPAGVGKTTLGAEVARRLLERLPDGVWLVELAPLRDAAEVIPAAATALGIRRLGRGAAPSDRDALVVLHERLRGAEALLVLDGAEHLLPAAGRAVLDLAGAGEGVRVLVTSRRPLGVPGEAVLAVAPLPIPAAPADVDRSPASRLFCERAAAARPGWALRDAEADAVARICRRLDGLPLALELAASRLRALSARTIADRLDAGLAVLGTLDASIEASHVLLSPAEQELFRRLSVFEGAFELEDAEHVGAGDGLAHDQVLEALVALTEHSMVQAEGDAPRRYHLLEALRAYARARLDAEAAEAARRRHAGRMAELASRTAARVDTDGAELAGEPLVARRADLDAAFRHALERGDADLALDLATGLGALHHRLGSVSVGVACLERALALGGEPRRRLDALWWHVPLLLAELRVGDARVALDDALALGAAHADERRLAGLRLLEGQVALCGGDLDGAAARLDGLAEACERRGERFTAAMASHLLGLTALARGAGEDAVALLRVAQDAFAACPDVCSHDGAAADLAETCALIGDAAGAAAVCEAAIGRAPERPLGERNTHLLHQAAVAAARASDWERAARLAGAAGTAARRDPVALGPWHAPAALGDVALHAGDAETAAGHYREALGMATAVRDAVGASLPTSLQLLASELRLAEAAMATGDRDAALAHGRAALRHGADAGAPGPLRAASAAVRHLDGAVAGR